MSSSQEPEIAKPHYQDADSYDYLTEDELDEQDAEQLRDRKVMSVINPGADGIATIAPAEPEGT